MFIDQSVGGFADIPLAVGYQLAASETSAATAWLTVKLPTGKAEDFTGSGAVDVALTVAAERRVAERWQLFGQANVAWLGDGDVLPEVQESYAWSALAGVSWNAWRALDLTLQLEANSAVLDTGIEELDGDAVVLTFGGTYRTTGGWQFDVGVSEDVEVDASSRRRVQHRRSPRILKVQSTGSDENSATSPWSLRKNRKRRSRSPGMK